MTFSLRLSRARTGVVAMRQATTTIGYHEIGEKKGGKIKKSLSPIISLPL